MWVLKVYNRFLNLLIKQKFLRRDNATTAELNRVGNHFFKDKYLGTFPSDMIPSEPGYSIVNLDDSSMSGSHWVAHIRTKNKTYIYDSFGRETTKILPNISKPTIDSEYDAEQRIQEKDCGARSMAFLLTANLLGIKRALLI